MYPLFLSAFSAPDANQELFSSFEYTDFFRQSSTEDANGFLYRYAFHNAWDVEYRIGLVSCQYNDLQLRGQLSKFTDRSGQIDFEMPQQFMRLKVAKEMGAYTLETQLDLGRDLGAGLGFGRQSPAGQWNASLFLNERRAELDYTVQNSKGYIPFYWLDAGALAEWEIESHAASLNLHATIPSDQDSLFFNALNVYSAEARSHHTLSEDWELKCRGDYLYASARLKYRGDQYGHLDGLNMLSGGAELIRHRGRRACSIGLDTYHTWIGDDSYFDIWPFTAWDTFLAHRTRIKRLHLSLYSPFLGLSYQNKAPEEQGWRYRGQFSYHHHFQAEDILIRNRKVVLYPFLFSYEDVDFELLNKLDAHVELKMQFSYRYYCGGINLEIAQLAPIKWSRISDLDFEAPSDPEAGKRRQWGGTSVILSANLRF